MEFREEALRRVQEGATPIRLLAQELGVHVETLRNWRRDARTAGYAAPDERPPTLAEENGALRRENARLKEELEILTKSHGLLRQGCALRYAFIRAHERTWRASTLCRVLEVSRAGYSKRRAEPFGRRQQADAAQLVHVRQQFYRLRRRYGSPRLHRELRAVGHVRSEKRVARLMRLAGLRAKGAYPFVVSTNSNHEQPIAPNLLGRRFAIGDRPDLNRRWAADITYVPTRQGWLHLAVILDVASRRVVGWATSVRLDQDLVLAALKMARRRRGGCGALQHSDRGSQNASVAYQRALREGGFTCSMSRTGVCWDNAVVESFFATLTKDLLDDGVFATRDDARRELGTFIEAWYNRERRHSSRGFRSPVEYEEQLRRVG